ncbi:MAG: DUF393 domain-containing protein [Bdellovibrionaceae bacterium]|nr:DUF393 domain-containing protein [Pseudobdellovibrionaceae bacterium]MBX3033887.1 DUF393 domain-containing protein [Pseudobdellovibrionaceae bacterium]
MDFVVRRDRAGRLRFAPLQGQTAARLLSEEDRRDFDSVLVLHDGRIEKRSDAVLSVFSRLPLPWSVLARLGRRLPRRLRDAIYSFIARRRYAWFGQADSCRLPTEQERRFLLD